MQYRLSEFFRGGVITVADQCAKAFVVLEDRFLDLKYYELSCYVGKILQEFLQKFQSEKHIATMLKIIRDIIIILYKAGA